MKRLSTLFFLVFILASACSEAVSVEGVKSFSISSSAEKVVDGMFVDGNYQLKGTDCRTTDKARTGEYSLALNDQQQFGFSIEFSDIKEGDAFIVSVWRSLDDGMGSIIISGDGDEGGLYEQNGEVIKRENGWGLIETSFVAPKNYTDLKIYLFNGEKETAYFDDIEIKGFFEHQKPTSEEGALEIELSQSALDTLSSYRDRALEQGVITDELKQYLNASIVVEGKKIPVELRLKGDWTDHLETDKWSFRIKVSGDNSYDGLKTFSIQNPSTRSFMMEWFGHKLFEKEDVLTTRYDFVPVIINGEKKGVYALEEHFDKQLLESRNRREGPIVKFDEGGVWEQHLIEANEGKYYHLPTLLAADIKPFKKNRTYKSPTLKSGFEVAKSHMNRYRNHDPAVDEYFDVDRVAKFLALTDVLNAKHGLIWHNQRNYQNPVTNKMEPIAYDCYTSLEHMHQDVDLIGVKWMEKKSYTIFEALLSNQEVNDLYLKYLKKYGDEKFMKGVLRNLENEISENEELLQHEYPFYEFNADFFTSNCNQIRTKLKRFEKGRTHVEKENYKAQLNFVTLPENEIYKKIALKANVVYRDSLKTKVELSNFHSHNILVTGYILKRNKDSVIQLRQPLSFKAYNSRQKSKSITLPEKPYKFIYAASNCKGQMFKQKVSKWSPVYFVPGVAESNYSQLLFQKNENVLKLKKGVYTVNQDVVIPKGHKVLFDPGVKIDFKNNAAFISYSPVSLNGTKSLGIEITSSDQTANGFIILAENTASKMSYTRFNGINTMNRENWTLTGAVTFYESKVDLTHCSFKDNLCEDGLNLIRCEFTIDECEVSNTFSDGFDADFCKGTLSNSRFKNTGNDCIDFSGSQIEVKNCTISGAGDKGISGGENSQLVVSNCSIDGAHIAIAAKDFSTVNVSESTIKSSKYGFAVYRKKPEYGPAKIVVESMKTNNAKHLHLIEKDSKLIYLDKEYLGKTKFNIDSMYMAYSESNNSM